MTIHQTAAQIALETARIASMAQSANDQCQRMQARIEELEGALRALIAGCKGLPEDVKVVNLGLARAILAKGN